jgi:hypothetical protein
MAMDTATTNTSASANPTMPPVIASMSPEQRQARIRELQSDPGVQQAMQLKSARDASWQQMMKMYGNYIMGTSEGKGKKKSSSKSKSGGKSSDEPENPVALLQSNDPHDKAKGWYMLAVKAGPPDDYQVRQLLSAESQQLQKLNENQRRLVSGQQTIDTDVQSKRLELHKLQNTDPSTLDDKQKQRLPQLQEDLELFPQLSRQTPHYGTQQIPGSSITGNDPRTGQPWRDAFGNPIDPKKHYQERTTGNDREYLPVEPKSVKTPNRDDRYIGILEKHNLGEPLSDEDKAYLGAYQLYTRQTKIDPGVARAAAFGANRFVPVLDPNNPENVIYMRVGDAAKAEIGSPQSISFQIDKAITKAFTSGQPATNINFFNTAVDHLSLLEEANKALANRDTQLLNKVGNAWATATGQPAPTDFNAVRNAVAGELAKTFTGARATKEEIALMNKTINDAMSPEQLSSVVSYYKSLMAGKLNALKGQYEAGKEGKPAFKDESGSGLLDDGTAKPSQGKQGRKRNAATPGATSSTDPNDPAGIL